MHARHIAAFEEPFQDRTATKSCMDWTNCMAWVARPAMDFEDSTFVIIAAELPKVGWSSTAISTDRAMGWNSKAFRIIIDSD